MVPIGKGVHHAGQPDHDLGVDGTKKGAVGCVRGTGASQVDQDSLSETDFELFSRPGCPYGGIRKGGSDSGD